MNKLLGVDIDTIIKRVLVETLGAEKDVQDKKSKEMKDFKAPPDSGKKKSDEAVDEAEDEESPVQTPDEADKSVKASDIVDLLGRMRSGQSLKDEKVRKDFQEYFNGLGVDKDNQKAANYYRHAADQGLKYAQHNLAAMHSAGIGVSEDLKKAAEWYLLAAQQGYGPSQYNLAFMYGNGKGVQQDDVTATMRGNMANFNGVDIRVMAHVVHPRLSKDEIERANELTRAFKEKYPKAYGDTIIPCEGCWGR